MALISDEYRILNRQAHADPAYGTSGHLHAALVQSVLDDGDSLLDYGCGKQTLRSAIRCAEYRAYDPAIPGLDAQPTPADVVYCGDVMEHVEPDCTDVVLEHVMRLARIAAVFVICCEGGRRILGDGKPAHRNVHPPQFWRDRLSKFGRLEEHPGISKKREVRIVVWR